MSLRIATYCTLRPVSYLLCLLLLPLLVLPTGCAVNASAGAASQLDKQQAEAATAVVSTQFFGMVIRTAGATPTITLGSRRLWDAGVTWAAVEPAPGSFVWQTLDAEVSAAEQQGQQVVLTLGMTPTWASSDPSAASAYGAGATAMPVNLADWDAYVSAVATRYAGRIAAYEVWNAPETPAYWSGAPTGLGGDIATLAQHAAADVHAAAPSAQIVSPALSSAGLAAFLAAGGGASIDVVGAMLDTPGTAPEQMTETLSDLRQTIAGSAAAGKPIWNEQAAWQLPASGLSAAMQFAYVARAVLLNAGYGVARMHWYAWDDNAVNSLVLSNGDTQPTAAALAYATVESWVAGAQMNGCSATAQGVWTCQIVQNGKVAWVVWSPSGTVSSSSYGATTQTTLGGSVSQIGGNSTVEVGPSPVLLQ